MRETIRTVAALIAAVTLMLGLGTCAAGAADAADAASVAGASTGRIVLGSVHAYPEGSQGWGKAHPGHIFNGGDPSGYVGHIVWRGWRSSTAHGHGLGNASKPGGGYYARQVKVQLKASHLGHCTAGGPRAYTRLVFREQKRPGSSHWTAWHRWGGRPTICSFS